MNARLSPQPLLSASIMLTHTVRTGPLRSLLGGATLTRQFSRSPHRLDSKPSIANIAEIRRLLPGTTMIKAREALGSTSNDVSAAISWLEKDSAISGAKKASKVGNRQAREGGVGVSIIVDGAPTAGDSGLPQQAPPTMAAKAGIVELNCETDFVGRNEIFQALLTDLAYTVALFPTLAANEEAAGSSSSSSSSAGAQEMLDIPIDALLQFPLMSSEQRSGDSLPKTVGDAILGVVSRLGERVHLARASALSNAAVPPADAPRRSEVSADTPSWLVASAFTHGGINQQAATTSSQQPVVFSSSGKVGSLLLTRFDRPRAQSRRDEASVKAMKAMARSLARQSAGMPTRQIRGEYDDQLSLYSQPFLLRLKAANLLQDAQGQHGSEQQEESVQASLTRWGKTWMAGEALGHEPVSVLCLRRWELGEEAVEEQP